VRYEDDPVLGGGQQLIFCAVVSFFWLGSLSRGWVPRLPLADAITRLGVEGSIEMVEGMEYVCRPN
jgi:hypothetical protein